MINVNDIYEEGEVWFKGEYGTVKGLDKGGDFKIGYGENCVCVDNEMLDFMIKNRKKNE